MIIDLSCTLSPVTIVINIHSPYLHPKLCKDSLGWSLGIVIKKGYLSGKEGLSALSLNSTFIKCIVQNGKTLKVRQEQYL